MMSVLNLQTSEGKWDPCSSRFFFSGHEYDSCAELASKGRRTVEIDAMIARGDLRIPVSVATPQEVDAKFNDDLQALVKAANSKLQIFKLNDQFQPANIVTLEVFLRKRNASANDRLRELYKDLTDCFFTLQQPHAAVRKTVLSPVAVDQCKETGSGAKRKLEAVDFPVQIPSAGVDFPSETPMHGNLPEILVTPIKRKKLLQPSSIPQIGDLDTNRFKNVSDRCDVSGPCTVFESTLDPNKGPDSFWLQLEGVSSTDEPQQFGVLNPLASLNHPSLHITVQPPVGEVPEVKFAIGAESLVTIECKELGTDNVITDVFSKIILRITEELGKTVELPEYTVQLQVPEGGAEGVSRGKKKARTSLVSVVPKSQEPYLSGPDSCLWFFEDMKSSLTGGFKVGWNLKAEVSDDSDLCQLTVLGISLFPAKKMKVTHGAMYSFAVFPELPDKGTEG